MPSLKYHSHETRHGTQFSHIILTPGQPLLFSCSNISVVRTKVYHFQSPWYYSTIVHVSKMFPSSISVYRKNAGTADIIFFISTSGSWILKILILKKQLKIKYDFKNNNKIKPFYTLLMLLYSLFVSEIFRSTILL